MDGGDNEDLFGKIYTYDELLTVERPAWERRRRAENEPLERPAHWPADTVPDSGTRVFWLPEGWTQAIKTTNSGKTLKCYVTPGDEFKRFFHKKDVEAHIGHALESKPPKRETSEPGVATVPSVHEAVPKWPDHDWLPKDWRVAFRRLPSKLHTIFVPPGQEDGFLYHRSDVEKYLTGEKTTLSLFGTSKPQSVISLHAGKGESYPAKKKHRVHTARVAREEDYVESSSIGVYDVLRDDAEAHLRAAGVPDAEATVLTAKNLFLQLVQRGFGPDTQMLAVASRLPHDAIAAGEALPGLLEMISGFYCSLPGTYAGRSCYQKVVIGSEVSLACWGQYISWSEGQQRWKIGALDEALAGYAYSPDSRPEPAGSQPWYLLRKDEAQQATA